MDDNKNPGLNPVAPQQDPPQGNPDQPSVDQPSSPTPPPSVGIDVPPPPPPAESGGQPPSPASPPPSPPSSDSPPPESAPNVDPASVPSDAPGDSPPNDSGDSGNSGLPPVIPSQPKKPKGKIIAAIAALVLLVVSIPAGIFLVQQSQELREKAAGPDWQCTTTGDKYATETDCRTVCPSAGACLFIGDTQPPGSSNCECMNGAWRTPLGASLVCERDGQACSTGTTPPDGQVDECPTPGASCGTCDAIDSCSDGSACSSGHRYCESQATGNVCGSCVKEVDNCSTQCSTGGTPPDGISSESDGQGGCCDAGAAANSSQGCRTTGGFNEVCDISNGACQSGLSCRSLSGCGQDSDCGPGNKCINQQCQGTGGPAPTSTPPTRSVSPTATISGPSGGFVGNDLIYTAIARGQNLQWSRIYWAKTTDDITDGSVWTEIAENHVNRTDGKVCESKTQCTTTGIFKPTANGSYYLAASASDADGGPCSGNPRYDSAPGWADCGGTNDVITVNVVSDLATAANCTELQVLDSNGGVVQDLSQISIGDTVTFQTFCFSTDASDDLDKIRFRVIGPSRSASDSDKAVTRAPEKEDSTAAAISYRFFKASHDMTITESGAYKVQTWGHAPKRGWIGK